MIADLAWGSLVGAGGLIPILRNLTLHSHEISAYELGRATEECLYVDKANLVDIQRR